MWYQFEDDRSPLADWQEIKSMILKYFRPGEDGDLFEQWMAVEQRRSVAEYRKKFVSKLKHLGRVDELVMLGTFLRGLKDEVRYELNYRGEQIRRLSEKKLREKRAKGLCFQCDGKWLTNHVCSRKEMIVLIGADGDEKEEDKRYCGGNRGG